MNSSWFFRLEMLFISPFLVIMCFRYFDEALAFVRNLVAGLSLQVVCFSENLYWLQIDRLLASLSSNFMIFCFLSDGGYSLPQLKLIFQDFVFFFYQIEKKGSRNLLYLVLSSKSDLQTFTQPRWWLVKNNIIPIMHFTFIKILLFSFI
jgi:hypothetical protein